MSSGKGGKGANLESLGNRALFEDGVKGRKPGANRRKRPALPPPSPPLNIAVSSVPLLRNCPGFICLTHGVHFNRPRRRSAPPSNRRKVAKMVGSNQCHRQSRRFYWPILLKMAERVSVQPTDNARLLWPSPGASTTRSTDARLCHRAMVRRVDHHRARPRALLSADAPARLRHLPADRRRVCRRRARPVADTDHLLSFGLDGNLRDLRPVRRDHLQESLLQERPGCPLRHPELRRHAVALTISAGRRGAMPEAGAVLRWRTEKNKADAPERWRR
jgi:hypothetical protein